MRWRRAGRGSGTPFLLPGPVATCADNSWSSCPAGVALSYGDAVLDRVSAFVAATRQNALQSLLTAEQSPVSLGACARFNVTNTQAGRLLLQFGIPAAGSADPQPLFSYNSANAGTSSEFGSGWTNAYKRSVTATSGSAANVVTGTGATQQFSGLVGGSGYYLPPPESRNSLSKDANGWTEQQPDGTAYRYNTSGVLQYVANPAGGRWTVSYTGVNRIKAIVDPFAGRTTLSYTATQFLKRVQDSAGRITTFSVSSSGNNLTRIQTPDLALTTLTYYPAGGAAGGQLKSWTTPLGLRTTFTYAPSSNWLNQIIAPNGQRTTYPVPASGKLSVVNPLGQRTTVTTALIPAILTTVPVSVLNPLGQRTTYSWSSAGLLQSVSSSLGGRTSFGYSSLANRTSQLASVTAPTGGRVSLLYDASYRIKAAIDPLGNRTTVLWGTGTSRAASLNPLGQRTSFTANSTGQLTAVKNPLLQITSYAYSTVGAADGAGQPAGAADVVCLQRQQPVAADAGPLGNITTYLRDVMNRVLATVDPLLRRVSYSYDSNGNNTAIKDPLGRITTQVFDTDGHLVAVVDPLSAADELRLRRQLQPHPGDERAGADHDQRVQRQQPAGGHRQPAVESNLVRLRRQRQPGEREERPGADQHDGVRHEQPSGGAGGRAGQPLHDDL